MCHETFKSKNKLFAHLGYIGLGRGTPKKIYLGRLAIYTFNKELQKDLFTIDPTYRGEPYAESDAFADDNAVDEVIIESKENSATKIGIG